MPLSIGKSGSSKISSKNAFSTRDLGTVDSNHKDKMAYFRERRDNLPELKKQLEELEEEYKVMKSGPPPDDAISYMKDLHRLETDIESTKDDIEKIENNGEELDYMLTTGTLLFRYYDNVNNPMAVSHSPPRNVWATTRELTTRTSRRSSRRPKRFQRPALKSVTQQSLTSTMSRGEMLDEFKALTDPYWVKKTESKEKKEESICEDCQVPKVLQYKESKYICPKCGIEEVTFIDSDRPSFKDPPPDANYFAYKRINHFNELLAQFQAKESTHIPKEVFDAIKKELKKERKEIKDLDYDLVKNYLKKYNAPPKNYTQYYDHIYHIINRLNGDKPLNMTPEMENNLRYLFLQIQGPFDKYCPPERKNFISYNFVFYKFCKLLGYHEFLKYFPLLKSKDKLYEQEKIWQKIMTEIGLPHK